MLHRQVLFLTLFLGFLTDHGLAAECTSIAPDPKNPHNHSVDIDMPDYYCLQENVVQSPIFDIHAFSFKKPSSPLLGIDYNPRGQHRNPVTRQWEPNRPLTDGDVFDVDLKGHTLKGKADNLFAVRSFAPRNIRIHNGFIDVPGNEEGNIGIWILSEIRIKTPRSTGAGATNAPDFEDIATTETVDGKPPIYVPSNSIIEKMTIKAGWRGVDMRGANNILRHNTIEVDGHTAVFMAGPGSVIEDNTIIIHGKGDAGPFDAPIKLRDAHAAIVRNNRIVYRGWFFKAPATVNLLDSTHVVIENNTVEGFKALTRCKGECTFSDKGNSLK